MTFKVLGLLAAIGLVLFLVVVLTSGEKKLTRPAKEWQAEPWMERDTSLPSVLPARVLALTDLPPLEPVPSPDDMVAAIKKSQDAGCNGAVLTFSWPSLEPSQGAYSLDELKGTVALNQGRILFLGIQILNTTVKDLPIDLQGKQFDDPLILERFCSFLDALAPLLKNRVSYLSIGNESDIYLSIHPDEIETFGVFLNRARQHAKEIAPHLMIGTTLTDSGALRPEMQKLTAQADAHFLTYYHGQVGLEGAFKNTKNTKDEILALATQFDERPIVFQEIGFPANTEISSPDKQAEFVRGVFDAWDELGDRIPFLNYFMMYDFPDAIIKDQLAYYGVSENTKPLVKFLSSLGLHETNGKPRPGWEIFHRRGNLIK
ncbi:hypothetical protein [uncultured Gimesia sp.]|uniref:hypothetical protein n=1 Tax=uncultured Gimesia sp. TaxID=1678688 RepID=UPI00261AD284|nr:hypothetical protein [uncultured Gimesia sp.]